MKVRPLHDRVIIKRCAAEQTTASGIVLPDAATEKPDQGDVVAVGKGRVGEDGKVVPLELKVGDRVLFGKYSGQAFKIFGEEYLQMSESDVIGVLEQ